jgi:hypothetical protein
MSGPPYALGYGDSSAEDIFSAFRDRIAIKELEVVAVVHAEAAVQYASHAVINKTRSGVVPAIRAEILFDLGIKWQNLH